MNYRSYTIQPSEGLPGKTEYFLDGGVTMIAESVKEAKREIDDRIFVETNYPVLLGGHREVYVWLTDALHMINYFNATPLFTFNAP
jgi:hypothetical protein